MAIILLFRDCDMSHSQQVVNKVKQTIDAHTFEAVDGFYLNPNSDISKRLFKDWPAQMQELEEWQKTSGYLKSYEDNLRANTKASRTNHRQDLEYSKSVDVSQNRQSRQSRRRLEN